MNLSDVKLKMRGNFFSLFICYFSINNFQVFANNLKLNYPAYTVASESYILDDSNACKRQLDIFKIAVDNKILWSLKSKYFVLPNSTINIKNIKQIL